MLVMGAPESVLGFQLPFFSMLSYVSETLVMLPRNTIVLVIPSLCAAMLLEPLSRSVFVGPRFKIAKFVAFLLKLLYFD